ncbi:MAG: hypothetical protein Q7V63_00480 [Gammaproteobacteria bacterium]|nr:hypothetical protein [Gammaproteobacteria bacterium]
MKIKFKHTVYISLLAIGLGGATCTFAYSWVGNGKTGTVAAIREKAEAKSSNTSIVQTQKPKAAVAVTPSKTPSTKTTPQTALPAPAQPAKVMSQKTAVANGTGATVSTTAAVAGMAAGINH